jgi:hypothetical protein
MHRSSSGLPARALISAHALKAGSVLGSGAPAEGAWVERCSSPVAAPEGLESFWLSVKSISDSRCLPATDALIGHIEGHNAEAHLMRL